MDAIVGHIRWMIRRDMPEVLHIENTSFEFPWTEEDFIRALRQRNCIGMVVEHDERIVGFMLYELHKTRLHLLNFAVHRDERGKGFGSHLITKLVSKLSTDRRNRIVLEIRETNIEGQAFFRSNGFVAISTIRGHFEDCCPPEDAYVMELRYGGSTESDYTPEIHEPPKAEPTPSGDQLIHHPEDLIEKRTYHVTYRDGSRFAGDFIALSHRKSGLRVRFRVDGGERVPMWKQLRQVIKQERPDTE